MGRLKLLGSSYHGLHGYRIALDLTRDDEHEFARLAKNKISRAMDLHS